MRTSESAALPAVRSKVPSFDGITVSIKPDADPKEVIASLHKCFEGLGKIRKIQQAAMYVIGAHLRVITDRQLYKPQYRSLEKFIQAEIVERYGISRTVAFDYRLIMTSLPKLNPAKAEKVNQANLLAGAKLIRDGLCSEEDAPALIEDAENLGPDEFQEKYPATIHGGTGRSVIRIPTTAKNAKLFWSWVGDRNPWECIVSWVERSHDAAVAKSRPQKTKTSRAVAS